MQNKGIFLTWIVVSDLEDAIKFYTESVGFTLRTTHKEMGWAELSGPGGCLLGLSQANPQFDLKAGTNAVPTITVDDIMTARNEFAKKGVKLIGDVMDVPGEVRLQTFVDKDGNTFQLVQLLRNH